MHEPYMKVTRNNSSDVIVIEIDPDGAAWLAEELQHLYDKDGAAKELINKIHSCLSDYEKDRR